MAEDDLIGSHMPTKTICRLRCFLDRNYHVNDEELLLDFLSKVLRWLPRERATAAELLNHKYIADWDAKVPKFAEEASKMKKVVFTSALRLEDAS